MAVSRDYKAMKSGRQLARDVTDTQLRRAEREPTKAELRELLAEAARNTAKQEASHDDGRRG
jgi:hypothetical protein